MQISVSKGTTKIVLTKNEQKILEGAGSILEALAKYDDKSATEAHGALVGGVRQKITEDGVYNPKG